LDANTFELSRSGSRIATRPKIFDLLKYLIEHRDVVVTKDELLHALWPGQHVDENAVPWTVGHARRVLGQRRSQKSPIETVHGRGYRWRMQTEVEERTQAKLTSSAATVVSPFVGRDQLIELLEARLAETVQGRGATCLLSGEAGIGKTRCLDELAVRARRLGFAVWRARCVEDQKAPVFYPWIVLLRAAIAEASEPERVQELLDGLSSGFPRSKRGRGLDGELALARMTLFDDVGRFLIDAARATPTLLTLDDAHWADLGTLELLATIAADLRDSHVFLAVGSRAGANAQLPEADKLWRAFERFELPPLQQRDVELYLQQSGAIALPSPPLCSALLASSAGNPLFLQEIVATLLTRHDRAALTTLACDEIKPGVRAREVMRERFAALPAASRVALQRASIFGEAFDAARVAQLSRQEPLDSLRALEAALSSGLVTVERPSGYRFKHALLRDAAYESMSEDERVALHRAAAEILESSPDAVLRSSEIAFHYHQSLALGDCGRVADAAARAAEAASQANAFADASRFYGWAIEAVSLTGEVRRRAELQLARARVQRLGGAVDDSRKSVLDLIEVASVHGYADLLIHAARTLRPSHLMSAYDDPLARESLKRALECIDPNNSALRAQALSLVACLPPIASDIARCQAFTAEALSLGRDSGCTEALADAFAARLYALSGPDDVVSLMELSAEMLTMDRHISGWMSVEALLARHAAFSLGFNLEAADASLTALSELAKKRGMRELMWHCERIRAQRLFLAGDIAHAEQEFGRLALEASRLRMSEVTQLCVIQTELLSVLHGGLQNYSAARDPGFFDALPHSLIPTCYRTNVGRLAAVHQQAAYARPLLEEFACRDFENVPRELSYLSSLCNLAVIALELRDRPRAERLYEILSPYADFNTPNSMSYCEGAVAYFLALLAELLDRPQRCAALFDRALELNRRLGEGPLLARTYYDSARFLASRDEPGAREQASLARELAEDLDMHSLAARAQTLLLH
jgi:DNA-binding winged helix-turn-helix (wHTH) protein